MKTLRYAFEDAVNAEARIVQAGLVPREPENAEEAGVLGECVVVVDLVDPSKDGQIATKNRS